MPAPLRSLPLVLLLAGSSGFTPLAAAPADGESAKTETPSPERNSGKQTDPQIVEALRLLREADVADAKEAALQRLAELGDKRAQYVRSERKKREKETSDPFATIPNDDALTTEDIVRDIPAEDRAILDLLLIPSGQSQTETQKKFQQVRAMGEKAHPALLRELLVARSTNITGPIVRVLMDGEGDKTKSLAILRQVVRERKDPSEETKQLRGFLIGQLPKYGGAAERDLLHELLKDPEPDIQWASMQCLAEIGDESSIPLLREWKERNPEHELSVERVIQQASKPLEDRKILSLVNRSDCGLSMIEEATVRKDRQLIAMGAKAYPALCRELLVTKDAYFAVKIVAAIRGSEGDKSLPLATFRKLLERRDWDREEDAKMLRWCIMGALGDFGNKEDLPRLHAALRDNDSMVNNACLESLAKIGDESSIEAIRAWRREARGPNDALEKNLDQAAEKTITAIQQRRKAGNRKE